MIILEISFYSSFKIRSENVVWTLLKRLSHVWIHWLTTLEWMMLHNLYVFTCDLIIQIFHFENVTVKQELNEIYWDSNELPAYIEILRIRWRNENHLCFVETHKLFNFSHREVGFVNVGLYNFLYWWSFLNDKIFSIWLKTRNIFFINLFQAFFLLVWQRFILEAIGNLGTYLDAMTLKATILVKGWIFIQIDHMNIDLVQTNTVSRIVFIENLTD